MRIPKKINICGKNYIIEIRNNRGNKDGIDSAASASEWSQRIWIDNDQHIEGQEEGLLHEIIELISRGMEFKLDHPTISGLSSVLYQVLKTNKMLR